MRPLRYRWERYKTNLRQENLLSMGQLSGQPAFDRPLLVGTFHKTGTVLIKKILREFCYLSGSNFVDLANDGLPEAEKPWLVAVEHSSKFEHYGLDPKLFPTAVLIRDPRDMLVSATKYHREAKEPWLHVARDEFGGSTYQEMINGLKNDEERLHFELKQNTGPRIERMLARKRSNEHRNTLFVHLEDLMNDRKLSVYNSFFMHLGINPAFLPLALTIAYKNSVFSPHFRSSKHITTGKTGTWRSTLPSSVLEELHTLHPTAISELGYDRL